MLIAGIAVFAQNVGINTADPKGKLDIKGTLRIGKVDKSNKTIPLLWIPNDGENQGQHHPGKIIDGQNHKPFKIIDYKFHVNADTEDYINDVDLKIPASKYTLVMSNTSLEDDVNHEPADVQALGVRGDKFIPIYVGIVKTRDHIFARKDDGNVPIDENEAHTGPIVVGFKQLMVYIKDGTLASIRRLSGIYIHRL